MVGEVVLAKDVAVNYARLRGFREVGYAGGEDCVAVVGAAVAGEEADETLRERGQVF